MDTLSSAWQWRFRWDQRGPGFPEAFEGVFCVGKERYDLQWATTLQEGNGSICLKTKETAAEHWFLHGQLDCRAG